MEVSAEADECVDALGDLPDITGSSKSTVWGCAVLLLLAVVLAKILAVSRGAYCTGVRQPLVPRPSRFSINPSSCGPGGI